MTQKLILLVLMMTISMGIKAQEKTINKSYDGIKGISLNTGSGNCRIVKGGSKVEVKLVYDFDDDVFTPVFEQDGDKLILKEKFERNSSSNGESNWTLSVPDNIEIGFNTGSGDLMAKSLSLELNSNSGSGDVSLDYIKGEVKINTGSGDFDGESFDGTLKVNAGSGDMNLDDSKGDFSINIGSGDISANGLTGEFSMNVGSGDIIAKDLSLTGGSSFNSGSGDAEVSLKTELKNDISVNSGSGDATLDFSGLEIKGEITMKANKRNGTISAPFDFDSVTEEGQGNQTIIKKTAQIGNSKVAIKVSTGSGRAAIEK